MIKAAALDDEYHALERFKMLADETGELEVCGLFETFSGLMNFLKDNSVDVVFLDIEMPGVNGMDIIDDIMNLRPHIEIVFITAYNIYAVQAFENNALDYILKPLTYKRLSKTIGRIKKIAGHLNVTGKPFFKCFGSFEIYVQNKSVLWPNAKSKEILAFLVHKCGTAVSWEVIVEAVWPDYTDFEKAHANFHSTMYLLRKQLGDLGISSILECKRNSYRISTDMISCDYYDFIAMPENRQKSTTEGVYLEESGYQWAYSRAVEIERLIKK
jgi:two-component SAPR family response regulator